MAEDQDVDQTVTHDTVSTPALTASNVLPGSSQLGYAHCEGHDQSRKVGGDEPEVIDLLSSSEDEPTDRRADDDELGESNGKDDRQVATQGQIRDDGDSESTASLQRDPSEEGDEEGSTAMADNSNGADEDGDVVHEERSPPVTTNAGPLSEVAGSKNVPLSPPIGVSPETGLVTPLGVGGGTQATAEEQKSSQKSSYSTQHAGGSPKEVPQFQSSQNGSSGSQNPGSQNLSGISQNSGPLTDSGPASFGSVNVPGSLSVIVHDDNDSQVTEPLEEAHTPSNQPTSMSAGSPTQDLVATTQDEIQDLAAPDNEGDEKEVALDKSDTQNFPEVVKETQEFIENNEETQEFIENNEETQDLIENNEETQEFVEDSMAIENLVDGDVDDQNPVTQDPLTRLESLDKSQDLRNVGMDSHPNEHDGAPEGNPGLTEMRSTDHNDAKPGVGDVVMQDGGDGVSIGDDGVDVSGNPPSSTAERGEEKALPRSNPASDKSPRLTNFANEDEEFEAISRVVNQAGSQAGPSTVERSVDGIKTPTVEEVGSRSDDEDTQSESNKRAVDEPAESGARKKRKEVHMKIRTELGMLEQLFPGTSDENAEFSRAEMERQIKDVHKVMNRADVRWSAHAKELLHSAIVRYTDSVFNDASKLVEVESRTMIERTDLHTVLMVKKWLNENDKGILLDLEDAPLRITSLLVQEESFVPYSRNITMDVGYDFSLGEEIGVCWSISFQSSLLSPFTRKLLGQGMDIIESSNNTELLVEGPPVDASALYEGTQKASALIFSGSYKDQVFFRCCFLVTMATEDDPRVQHLLETLSPEDEMECGKLGKKWFRHVHTDEVRASYFDIDWTKEVQPAAGENVNDNDNDNLNDNAEDNDNDNDNAEDNDNDNDNESDDIDEDDGDDDVEMTETADNEGGTDEPNPVRSDPKTASRAPQPPTVDDSDAEASQYGNISAETPDVLPPDNNIFLSKSNFLDFMGQFYDSLQSWTTHLVNARLSTFKESVLDEVRNTVHSADEPHNLHNFRKSLLKEVRQVVKDGASSNVDDIRGGVDNDVVPCSWRPSFKEKADTNEEFEPVLVPRGHLRSYEDLVGTIRDSFPAAKARKKMCITYRDKVGDSNDLDECSNWNLFLESVQSVHASPARIIQLPESLAKKMRPHSGPSL